MPHDLSDIRKLRKKLSLTQAQLAKKAGVSQSLIAKIEAGTLDPGYTKTVQIFETLDTLTRKDELTAGQIMNKRVVTTKAEEKVIRIIKEMKKYAISQIPVMERDKPVGLITETAILDKMSTGKDMTCLHARDVMEECPPIITPTTRISAIAHLLHHFPVVLVSDKGIPCGLVSKADFIEKIVE